VNLDKLKPLLPTNVFNELPEVISKFKIDTPLRLAHFLSQTAHESANYTRTIENLNYSEQGLLTTFKKYFTPATAKEYARKPEKIANRVYANRMENGPESSGDGWKFRGRGYIQLTGRSNYKAFDAFVPEDIVSNPDLVATKYPLLSAAWFWSVNNLNSIADKGTNSTAVRKKINGGTIGLTDTQNKFNIFYKALQPV
jgi:putative chitinase